MELAAEVSGELWTGVNFSEGLLVMDNGVPLLLEDFGAGFNATGAAAGNLSGDVVQLAGLLADESGAEFHRVISVLHVYVLPVIILIGIVGNTVSFLVYVSTPRLYRQSSSLYLAFLVPSELQPLPRLPPTVRAPASTSLSLRLYLQSSSLYLAFLLLSELQPLPRLPRAARAPVFTSPSSIR